MQHPITVVIGFPLDPIYLDRLRLGFPDIAFRVSTSKEDLMTMVGDAQVFIGWPNNAVVAAASALRWIHIPGAGIDAFDSAPLVERGVIVTNSRGVAAPNIAEHVFAMMLGFARALPQLARAQQEERWSKPREMRFFELGGQTLVIAGMGEIGTALATRALAFGTTVVGVRQSPTPVAGVNIVAPDRLAEVAAIADHLVACLPATPATAGIFNAALFSRMKPGSYFYNVGRGTAVVTGDLLAALDSGQIAGAGLDVVEPEPLSTGHPVWHHPNITMTAHTSGHTVQYWRRGIVLLERLLSQYRAGAPLDNQVNLRRGY